MLFRYLDLINDHINLQIEPSKWIIERVIVSVQMSGERVGFRFKHADAVVKRNPQGRSRRGWVMEPVEQTTSRGTKMPAYRIRWRDSERPEIVLQHMLIADPDPSPPPENVSLNFEG